MSRTRGFIAIAHVARSHGTQGELRLQPLTHSPERFNVREHHAVRPPRGSYFVHEMIGAEVRTDEGKTVGRIVDVLTLPANDAWVVRTNGTDVLIPAVKAIIKHVDLERRTVVIHALEGLFE